MSERIFYVSLEGNDNWTGNYDRPNSSLTDGPFATLERARDEIRKLHSDENLKCPVKVMVRSGKYYLDKTFVLEKKDSGTPEYPITYMAYPGEKPVISGGMRVTGWYPYKGEIMKCELPGSKGGKWKSRQLFCNGKRMRRSRWPKFEPENPLYGGWAFTEGPAEEGSTTEFIFKTGEFKNKWSKPTEGEVVYYAHFGGWCSISPIKARDDERHIITLAQEGYDWDIPGWHTKYPFAKDNRYYVENILEELDQPGEWCFDSEEGVLYFWPEDSKNTGEISVPKLDCLVEMNGTSWVTISGLTFTETLGGDSLNPQGVEGVGCMMGRVGWKYVGDALRMKDCEHCRILGNNFDQVGGNAVYLRFYNARNVICDNEIGYAGAGGIYLAGSTSEHPLFNDIGNNYIHNCGRINKGVAGVFTGMSDGNIIHNNKIEHMPHHGINLADTPNGRNIVEYNEVRFTCEENEDNGAINCWMETPPVKNLQRCGHVIRYNFISDIIGVHVENGKFGKSAGIFPSMGIYLDNYTSNCFVYGNIIARCSTTGVWIHGGKNNIVENNIFVDCKYSMVYFDAVSGLKYWKPMSNFMTGNSYCNNISYQTGTDVYMLWLCTWTSKTVAWSDRNVYYQSNNGNYLIKDYGSVEGGEKLQKVSEWQALGYELNSAFADPEFVDYEKDDFRLKPESPALKLGFISIPVEKIGLRKQLEP